MLSSAVHTTGINWTSLATIVGMLSSIIGGFTAWIIKRGERNRELVYKRIEKVAETLGSRLDRMDEHLDRQDGHVGRLGQRVARLEGPR